MVSIRREKTTANASMSTNPAKENFHEFRRNLKEKRGTRDLDFELIKREACWRRDVGGNKLKKETVLSRRYSHGVSRRYNNDAIQPWTLVNSQVHFSSISFP